MFFVAHPETLACTWHSPVFCAAMRLGLEAATIRKSIMKSLLPALALAAFSLSAFAQVTVKDAWVRATAPHQTATGAFLHITSVKDARLVAASSPLATVEIHEMRMENHVMKMRQIDGITLPAGKAVELKPGGYHLMLTGVKQPIKEGETVELRLTVESGKARETVALKAPVRALTATHGAKGHAGH
jgi:copper(I)-binding protein